MNDQPETLGQDVEFTGAAETGAHGIVFTPRELEMIAEGEASVAEFGTIPASEVHAWIESLFTSSPQPEPRKP